MPQLFHKCSQCDQATHLLTALKNFNSSLFLGFRPRSLAPTRPYTVWPHLLLQPHVRPHFLWLQSWPSTLVFFQVCALSSATGPLHMLSLLSGRLFPISVPQILALLLEGIHKGKKKKSILSYLISFHGCKNHEDKTKAPPSTWRRVSGGASKGKHSELECSGPATTI